MLGRKIYGKKRCGGKYKDKDGNVGVSQYLYGMMAEGVR